MMAGTSRKASGRTTVIEAIENATAQLITLERTIERTSEHSLGISSMASRGEHAVENGNLRLAAEIFSDVRRAGEQQRILLASMQSTLAAARSTLAAAREWGEG